MSEEEALASRDWCAFLNFVKIHIMKACAEFEYSSRKVSHSLLCPSVLKTRLFLLPARVKMPQTGGQTPQCRLLLLYIQGEKCNQVIIKSYLGKLHFYSWSNISLRIYLYIHWPDQLTKAESAEQEGKSQDLCQTLQTCWAVAQNRQHWLRADLSCQNKRQQPAYSSMSESGAGLVAACGGHLAGSAMEVSFTAFT